MHGKFNRTELITLPTITLYLFLFDVFALLKFGATMELNRDEIVRNRPMANPNSK